MVSRQTRKRGKSLRRLLSSSCTLIICLWGEFLLGLDALGQFVARVGAQERNAPGGYPGGGERAAAGSPPAAGIAEPDAPAPAESGFECFCGGGTGGLLIVHGSSCCGFRLSRRAWMRGVAAKLQSV